MGDYHAGITISEARSVALEVFKENSYIFTEIANTTINHRAEAITNDIFEVVFNELPDRIIKLIEPTIQEDLLKIQKSYAKNDSEQLKIQLIELLKSRLMVDEGDVEQLILDEALDIIPKLTNTQMNILSLHLAALRIAHGDVIDRESLFDVISERMLLFYGDDIHKTMNFAHLQYTGCTSILSEGGTYKPLEEILRNRYGGLFSKGFTKNDFDEYMGFDTSCMHDLISPSLIDNDLIQFAVMNLAALEQLIDITDNNQYKSKLVNYYKQNLMSPEEIKADIAKHIDGFEDLSNFWLESKDFKALSLTSVGIAIGVLNYNLKTQSQVRLISFIEK